MLRFSCFNAQIHSHKQKKTVQLSAKAMRKTLEECSKSQASKDFTNSTGTSPSHLKVERDTIDNSPDCVTHTSSGEHDWKSEEIKNSYNIESGVGVHKTSHMKKSQSLGSGLDWKGSVSNCNDLEDESEQGFSCDESQDRSVLVPVGDKGPGISLPNRYQEALPSGSLQVSSDMVNNESIFSIADPQESEKGHENSDTQISGECAGESSNHMPRMLPGIVKSSSLPNLGSSGGHSTSPYFKPCSRSCEDLKVLYLRWKGMLVHEVETRVVQKQERDDSVSKSNCENLADDRYNTCNYVGSAKHWIIPVMDDINPMDNLQGESSVYRSEELPSEDFKLKRIEEWVMDLHHSSPLEGTNEISTSDDHQEQSGGDTVLDGLTSVRLDGKIPAGMDAAKQYISSLSATATTAQLANHGLVVIPFLSAFVSLKVLNLSGNTIAKITAGTLPRALHTLNLSKNKISTIEGLRELTRLRVLDLSYNRIVRIGHGLAACSSLKELYLAGNKISEVEGLHRLLKLNVLDLRFNKISTTKCLGQLAANYNSLQAISLEGNPAQKNVGDEQLRKYLQGLLPHLAYYNRQSIKFGTLKDAADRSARLGITAHQIDRGLRSELKAMRKGSHCVTAHKMSSSSAHGRKSQALPSVKPSKDRHGHLPPSGTKTKTHRHHFYDLGSKLLSFRPDLSIRRSRSEGTLGAF